MNPSSNTLLDDITSLCLCTETVDLKHGGKSNVYFNMRRLLRNPALLKCISDELCDRMSNELFDAVCGAGGMAEVLAGHISATLAIPQIIVRETIKSRGVEPNIIGWDDSYNKILIVDDVLTTGNTVANYMTRIGDNKLFTILVIINRSNPYIGYIRGAPIMELYSLFDFRHLFPSEEMVQWNMARKRSNICFAADLPDATSVYKMVEDIKDVIFAVKIHPEIIKDFDWNIMRGIADKNNLLLIADLKLADVPHIVNRQLEQVAAADMVTLHSFIDIPETRRGLILVANMSTGWSAPIDRVMQKLQHKNVCGVVTQHLLETDKIQFTPGNLDAPTDVLIVGRKIYEAESPYAAALELKKKYS